MNEHSSPPSGGTTGEAVPEVELANEDILDAMQHIPGYPDITPGDFREIYHLAHHHAIDRLLGGLRAQGLMRPVAAPLPPGMMLDEAARAIVASGYKGLLVIERCFRSIKTTQIHLTPMHHWLPRRIEAHVKICVLALLVTSKDPLRF